jgi:hypothetical protein
MKTQNLWFLRRGEQVSGPFPAKLISRDLMLGRVQAVDEASVDQVFWSPVGEITDFKARIKVKQRVVGPANSPMDWYEERRQAALRWADERHSRDRRDVRETNPFMMNKRRADRRLHTESAEWAALRQRHAEWEAELKLRRDRFFGVAMVLLALLALAVFAVFNLAPVNPVKVGFHGPYAACSEPASSQVNWARCDKNGAWLKGVDLTSALLREARFNAANLSHSNLSYANLTGADLSFANLQQAKLVGANLTSSDLSYAELRDADLRYADLRGAKLDAATLIGARLDDATWVDGRHCVAISVGECK